MAETETDVWEGVRSRMREDNPGVIDLIDLRDLSLRDLEEVDDAQLRKVFESLLNDQTEPMAGFSSSLDRSR